MTEYDSDTRPMTVGDWMITMLILAIPLVNIVMLFVWGFGSGNVNRKNFCLAYLIYAAIFFALWLLMVVAFGGLAILSG